MTAPTIPSPDVAANIIQPLGLLRTAPTPFAPKPPDRRHEGMQPAGGAHVPGARIQFAKGACWLMPLIVWEAPDGYDVSLPLPHQDCHLLEWHLTSAPVQRLLPCGRALESMPANGFLLLPMTTPMRVKAAGPARFVQFRMPDAFLRAVAVDWLGEAAGCDGLLGCAQLMRSDPKLVAMLDAYLRRALDEDEAPSRLEMDSQAHLIALQILRGHSILADRHYSARRGGLAPYQLKRVCDRMMRDLAEEIPLDVLAREIGVSYHHFCHAFKISTGQPPRQWLVERRVEAACALLRSTRLTVAEVAAAVGYEDQNQLLRVFRGRRGMTPGAYRREFQHIGATEAAVP